MFGLLGVFLAVPAAALVHIVIDEFYLRPRRPDYAALDREAAALVEGKSSLFWGGKSNVNLPTDETENRIRSCVIALRLARRTQKRSRSLTGR